MSPCSITKSLESPGSDFSISISKRAPHEMSLQLVEIFNAQFFVGLLQSSDAVDINFSVCMCSNNICINITQLNLILLSNI